MTKFIKIWLVQLKNNWVREAVYRTNFLMAIVVDFVWMCVELALFSVIYSNTPTLVGWSKDQVYFFLGIFFASDALFTTFFQRNYWNFSDLVNRGDLDILLTKPVHPLFLALTRWMNLTSIFNVALGLVIAAKFAGPAGFVGGIHWLELGLWLILGLLTQILVRFTFSIWVFWTERSFALSRLYYQLFAFATKPDSFYPTAIRFFIMTALPFAFIGSVPARALLHGLQPSEYIHLVTVLTAFLVLDIVLWKKGLKRYQSASS